MWVKDHSRSSNWYHIKAWVRFPIQFIVTMAASLISSVKESRDPENCVRSRSRSLKMAPFDRPYTTFYWSAIVTIASSCAIFELFDVE